MNIDIRDAKFLAAADTLQSLPSAAFAEIAFAGRSNVGKSSLINTLVARKKLVRTSSTPGCTRGLNLFRVEFSDAVLDVVDLPGYGFAKRSKAERFSWGPLIEGYLKQRANLRAVVVIVDVRRGVEPDDQELIDFLRHAKREAVVVATKLDKLPLSQRKTALAAVAKDAGLRVIGFSSESGEGREQLWKRIFDLTQIREVKAPDTKLPT